MNHHKFLNQQPLKGLTKLHHKVTLNFHFILMEFLETTIFTRDTIKIKIKHS